MDKRISIHTLVILNLFLSIQLTKAQNVGIGTNTPNPSAQLDVNSTSRGFLPPRMTCAQRNMIVNPAAGLMIYCTDCANGEMQYYNGSNWMCMSIGIGSDSFVNLPSVTIGSQIWSSKNLDVQTYRNGDVIPQVTDRTTWANLTSGAWCWYNNDSASYASIYGKLYNWSAVNDPRGLAPRGWHVPTDAEWNRLVKYIHAGADTNCVNCYQSTIAGGAMKSTTLWSSPNAGATNSSGFTGLPGGGRGNGGYFDNVGVYGSWWSASENDAGLAWYRFLYYNRSDVSRHYDNKSYGCSVRVVRD